jgi:hypothetical protein
MLRQKKTSEKKLGVVGMRVRVAEGKKKKQTTRTRRKGTKRRKRRKGVKKQRKETDKEKNSKKEDKLKKMIINKIKTILERQKKKPCSQIHESKKQKRVYKK